MDWTLHADGEVEGAIQRLREDQRVHVQRSEDAALVELRANDVAAGAHAVIEICRRQRIAEDAEEIARLQAEQPVTTTRGAADGGR